MSDILGQAPLSKAGKLKKTSFSRVREFESDKMNKASNGLRPYNRSYSDLFGRKFSHQPYDIEKNSNLVGPIEKNEFSKFEAKRGNKLGNQGRLEGKKKVFSIDEKSILKSSKENSRV